MNAVGLKQAVDRICYLAFNAINDDQGCSSIIKNIHLCLDIWVDNILDVLDHLSPQLTNVKENGLHASYQENQKKDDDVISCTGKISSVSEPQDGSDLLLAADSTDLDSFATHLVYCPWGYWHQMNACLVLPS